MTLIKRFSDHEDDLIRRFHEHPFYQEFTQLTDTQLKTYLMQRWFLSQQFVPWYDSAINALTDNEAKDVLRKIVQDETPIDAPSHREDLIADLEYIGIPKAMLLSENPTRVTRKTIKELFEFTKYSDDPNFDLRTMVALRTAGEILVAEEYRHVVPELERRYGLTPEESRFYAPHFYHDRKDSETGQHTHSFDGVLERMIDSEERLQIAIATATDALGTRLRFQDQFYGQVSGRNASIAMGIVAAAAVAAIALTSLYGNGEITYKDCIPNEFEGIQHCVDK